MNTQALTDLVSEGYAIVPIVQGEKRPEHDGWLKRSFTPEEFSERHNVGVKCGGPSKHKVDVDLDAAEAVRAAELLPITRSHGRPGKPRSHHWYTCPDLKASLQYKDPVTGDMLCELRGTGGQTVVPPSTHPSGEALQWENREAYLPMSAEDLQRSVAEVATVALMARYWPSGSRHVAAGHLGGFLARLGVEAPHVERMTRLIATIAGDDEVGDRARFARESAEKHHRGEKTTGAPSIAEHFASGRALIKAIYGWFGREGDDEIEALNAQHFVAQLGANMVVGTEREDRILFQSFASFKEKYCHRRFGKQPLGDAWLKHPNRREFEEVVFAPPGARWAAGPRDYNQWKGFAVDPDLHPHPERRCARYLDHIHEVICCGNATHTTYVIDLLADVVQKPGRLIGKTLALRGGMGVGKSVFVEPFGWLFGRRHFMIVNSREQLVGEFNGHLSGKVVVFAEEAVWGGNRADAGTLKRLITQDTFTIRRLYVDAVNELNCVHLFMATNEQWVYPAGNHERRIVVLDVGNKRAPSYYGPLWDEIKSPGFGAALLATLLARSVNEERLRAGLNTKALAEIQDLSADPVQAWWRGVLEDGQISPNSDATWPTFAPVQALYQQFGDVMGARGAGVGNRGTPHSFSRKLQTLLPGDPVSEVRRAPLNVATSGAPVWQIKQQRGYALADLQKCRQHYDELTGLSHDWPVGVSDPVTPVFDDL